MVLPVAGLQLFLKLIQNGLPVNSGIWKKVTSKNKIKYNCFASAKSFSSSHVAIRNILFFGTDSFSLQTLKSLNDWINQEKQNNSKSKFTKCENDRHKITRLVVCTSQMKDLIQPVKIYADQNKLEVYQWPLDPDVIKDEGFDIGVVASFGHLIPKKIIDAFPEGILNVHGSLLPRWRGASPITHAIMAGDSKTGISIMEVKPHHFDIGKILATKSVNISCDETRDELATKMAKIGGDLMVQVLQDLHNYRVRSISQDADGVTYAPCINKSFYCIDWNTSTSRDVYNQYRALSESGKLYSTWEETGETVMFTNCLKPDIIDSFVYELKGNDYKPGQVKYHKTKLKKDDGNELQDNSKLQWFICIKCKTGWIAFENFYYGPNKKLSAVDFYNGYISNNRNRKHFFVNKS